MLEINSEKKNQKNRSVMLSLIKLTRRIVYTNVLRSLRGREKQKGGATQVLKGRLYIIYNGFIHITIEIQQLPSLL